VGVVPSPDAFPCIHLGCTDFLSFLCVYMGETFYVFDNGEVMSVGISLLEPVGDFSDPSVK
jgi:hypothetical protein